MYQFYRLIFYNETTSDTSAGISISDIVDVIKQNNSIKHHEDFLLSLCLSEQFQLGETETLQMESDRQSVNKVGEITN